MKPNDITSEAQSLLECVFAERPAPVEAIENWLTGFEQRRLQAKSDELLVLSEFEENDTKSNRLRIASEVLEAFLAPQKPVWQKSVSEEG